MCFLARHHMLRINSAQLYDRYIYLLQLEVYGIESELAVKIIHLLYVIYWYCASWNHEFMLAAL